MKKFWNIVFLLVFFVGGCSQSATIPPTVVDVTPSSTAVEETAAALQDTATVSPDVVQEKTQEPTQSQPVVKDFTAVPAPTLKPTPFLPVSGIETIKLASSEAISIISEANAAWTRYTILEWDKIEPVKVTPPEYHWNPDMEKAFQEAASANLTIIGTVKFTPDWAQKIPGVSCGAIAEEALERFGLFMYEAVKKYSQEPYNIHYWEIGNEVDVSPEVVPPNNIFGCWGDRADAYYGGGYYAEMLKAVYPQIKLADPDAQLLVGGLLMDCDRNNPPPDKDCASTLFLEGILKNSGGGYFDGVSFHAYDYYYQLFSYVNRNWLSHSETTGPVFLAKAKYLSDLLQQYGYPEKYLMLTEVAMLCGSKGTEPPCTTPDYYRSKSAYIAQMLVLARSINLRAAIWYSLEGWRATGLLQGRTMEGSQYKVFQFVSSFVSDARFVKNLDQYPDVRVFEFEKGGQRYWVMWHMKPVETVIQLPKIPAVIYNLNGNELPTGIDLTLTAEPVFVAWKD